MVIKNKFKEFLKEKSEILVVVFLAALVALTLQTGLFQKIDYRLYDSMLKIKKGIEADSDIVIVDIDDESLGRIGSWPWTRDILGNTLIRMKEFGSKQAVFDIEYISPSSKGVNENLGNTINKAFIEGESAISDSISGFAREIESGAVNAENVQSYKSSLVSDEIDGILYEMQKDITSDFELDYDDYFARCVQFFGNTSLTANMRHISRREDEYGDSYAKDRFLFSNVTDNKNLVQKGNILCAGDGGNRKLGFTPALHKILSRAQGIGFTNVIVDRDGIRRRIELLSFLDGKYVGQLSFAPLVKLLDIQSIERSSNAVVLHGLKYPESETRFDISIPVDKNGCMMINWLHEGYEESFRHVPAYLLYNLDLAEKLVIEKLAETKRADLSLLSEEDAEYILNSEYFEGEYETLSEKKKALLFKCRGFDKDGNAIRGGLSEQDYDEYFSARAEFFATLKEFTDSFALVPGAEQISAVMDLKESVELYLRDFEILKGSMEGAFCIIGNSATSSTDLGVTPFSRQYANLGLHANVINTILQGKFIREENPYCGLLFCFVFILLTMRITLNLTTGKKNLARFLYVVVPAGMFYVLMIQFNVYVPFTASFLFCFLNYFMGIIINFHAINSDKKFLQSTFSAYVAPAVVDEIIKNPENAKLGGNSRNITALFSDVKTFSGFTEAINNEEGESRGAERLVSILNGYLGDLSDAIMDCHGTIDKYVGDEIVSFFGAPVDDEENAFHACLAGIRMLQAEARYNEENRELLPINPSTGEPFYLNSRVGINTGNMVVGNMGTKKKLNYTIMGNNVNLASRLEGTNKVYNSWIMCSDSTWTEADKGKNAGLLVARKFDFVRVVNIEHPVQIHCILGLKNEMPEKQIEAAGIFNEGIEWYLRGRDFPDEKKDPEDFKKAYQLFKTAKECFPQDMSSDVFMKRCSYFLKYGSGEKWDGVFTMKEK
ncbi:CHASE2 domain-containing protein [Treponema sp.]|uniref:CHASE2 domain-containing protein n=1 Tax=Treponema sp. TaxID=166 RepID=UPI003F00A010